MAVVKVIELLGESEQSWEDARAMQFWHGSLSLSA
jgi:flavin-binding protein dodecin